MRIVFLIGSLQLGGAERVVCRLADHWAQQGHDVAIATVYPRETDFYALDARVQRIAFDLAKPTATKFHTAWQIFKRLRAIRRSLHAFRADIAVSFMTDMNILALTVQPFTRTPIIISERTNPERQTLSPMYRRIRRLLYPFTRLAVFVSHGVADAYPWLPAHKKLVIHNPCDAPPPALPLAARDKTVVALGRLVPIKGHDMLIDAFARIAERHPDWSLRIYGEGGHRPALEARIAESGLANRIELAGHTTEASAMLSHAGIFVLPSRHEGFPNALVEAMGAGLPVISFDCPHGPREIITPNVDGILLPPEDVACLAQALDKLMADPEMRQRLGDSARQINQRLDINTIAGQWQGVFAKVRQ